MKNLFLASALTALTFSSAHAADAIVYNDPVGEAPIAASFNWTGAYIGVNAGYAWNSGKRLNGLGYYYGDYYGTYDNDWFNGQSDNSSNSFTGGIQIGYNHQIDNFVFGLEADFNYLNLKKKNGFTGVTDLYSDASDLYNYHLRENLDTASKVEWFSTIRPRIGVLPDERLLVFATGGLAIGKVKSTGGYNWREYGFWWGGPGDHDFDRSGGFSGSNSKIQAGWTVGAGAEYAMTDKITLKGEYLYVDLGKKSHIVADPNDATEYVKWSNSTKFSAFRVGLNYKF